MDLIKYLKDDTWKTAQSNEVTGLTMFTIVRNDRCNAVGTFKYAIKEVKEDGALAMVILEGARGSSNDPLDKVRNVELRISDNNQITAINLDGDCVVKI